MLELKKPREKSVIEQLSRDFVDSLDDVDLHDFKTSGEGDAN